ncbi:MAG: DUF1819 family protein [Anaerolineales bacterium]|jgi:hypothetical protein|nr:DUF1819 family protein [Anaerolineales bacterium]
MSGESYLLSFTGASLSIRESIIIAEVYLRLRDWDAVKREVKGANLIQARTQSSIQRVYQELHPRLAGLSVEQLELLVDGNPQEQKQLLWFAICKRYVFIQEFASEVLREKFLRLDFELTEFDYDAFYNRKADWHPELDELKESSRQKMKTRIFRMLLEADLITPDSRIIPATLSPRLKDVLTPDAPLSYQIFPASNF